MKIIRLVPLLIVFGSLTSCKFFKEYRLFSKDIDTLLDESSSYVEEIAVDTIPSDTSDQIVESDLLEYESVQPEPEPVVQSGYGSSRYYMIVGSFQNELFAEKYARKLQEMGYQSQVISASNGYYRVSAKTYSSYREGVDDINNFRATVSASAWLHVKN